MDTHDFSFGRKKKALLRGVRESPWLISEGTGRCASEAQGERTELARNVRVQKSRGSGVARQVPARGGMMRTVPRTGAPATCGVEISQVDVNQRPGQAARANPSPSPPPPILTSTTTQHTTIDDDDDDENMPPTPLLPYHISLILQYISPPSQLDTPLPPHLISRALLQRHHFLSLSPEYDCPTYLTWSEDNRERAIALLEALPKFIDDLLVDAPVRYVVDTESAYAHVEVFSIGDDDEDGLRLVFQWDGHDSWRYHDANIMPFPPNGHASLKEALAKVDAEPYDAEVEIDDQPCQSGPSVGVSDDDDDYWNSYGGAEDDDDTSHKAHSRDVASKEGSDAGGEDAYWAQYASVHGPYVIIISCPSVLTTSIRTCVGTADSTIPSPEHKNKRKLHPHSNTHHHPHFRAQDHPHHVRSDEPLPVPFPLRHKASRPSAWNDPERAYPTGANGNHGAGADGRPISPRTLARRLVEMSPRQSPKGVPDTPNSGLDSVFDEMMPTEEYIEKEAVNGAQRSLEVSMSLGMDVLGGQASEEVSAGWVSEGDGATEEDDGDVTDIGASMGETDSDTPSPVSVEKSNPMNGTAKSAKEEEDERFRAYMVDDSGDDAGEDFITASSRPTQPSTVTSFLRTKVSEEDQDEDMDEGVDDDIGYMTMDGSVGDGGDDATEGVKEAIRGVYRLWRASRQRNSSRRDVDDGGGGGGYLKKNIADGAEFMRVVKEAITRS